MIEGLEGVLPFLKKSKNALRAQMESVMRTMNQVSISWHEDS